MRIIIAIFLCFIPIIPYPQITENVGIQANNFIVIQLANGRLSFQIECLNQSFEEREVDITVRGIDVRGNHITEINFGRLVPIGKAVKLSRFCSSNIFDLSDISKWLIYSVNSRHPVDDNLEAG